jgi:hypothetical protein
VGTSDRAHPIIVFLVVVTPSIPKCLMFDFLMLILITHIIQNISKL